MQKKLTKRLRTFTTPKYASPYNFIVVIITMTHNKEEIIYEWGNSNENAPPRQTSVDMIYYYEIRTTITNTRRTFFDIEYSNDTVSYMTHYSSVKETVESDRRTRITSII